MAASTGDKITDVRNAARPNSAKVTSGRSAGGTTLACDNLTGWPTASKVHFVTYQIDSSSAPVAGTQLDCTGIVSGNSIGSLTVVDGTDTGNSINDVVEMLPTAAWGQDLADALTNQHTRTGTHKSITNTGGITTDTLVVSSGTTLPAGDIGTADIASGSITGALLATSAISLGYTAITSTVTLTTPASDTLVTGLTATVTIPSGGRKVKITAYTSNLNCTNANSSTTLSIWDGTVGSGTQLSTWVNSSGTVGTDGHGANCVAVVTPSAGSKTYNVGLKTTAGNGVVTASATSPAFILVEAI